MTQYITVYLFDDATGAFMYPYDAQESPLEPGVYIEPISSTRVQPPAWPGGQWPYWTGTAWELRDAPA
jgi:hypothetical protein